MVKKYKFENYELYDEERYRKAAQTCEAIVCVKFPITTGPAWEEGQKSSHSESRLVPSSRTHNKLG